MGRRGASSVSREHVIADGPGGMVTVAGGKLTTYRLMAAEVVDHVVKRLQQRGPGRLAGGGRNRRRAPARRGVGEPRPDSRTRHRLRDRRRHGRAHAATLRHRGRRIFNLMRSEPGLADRLQPDHPAVSAEVLHAARKEFARTVADVLVRRVHLFYETRDQGARGGGADRRAAGPGAALEPGRAAAGGGRLPGPDRPDPAPHRRARTSANFQGFALPAVLAGVPLLPGE